MWCLFIAGGFLWGNVLFSEIITRRVKKQDVFNASDDGNPGTVNAFKICGVKWGLLCLFLDALKGFLPVLLATLLLNAHSWAMMFVVIAPVAGHAMGIYNGFRGGKCIAVSFGVLFGLLPVTWAALLLALPYVLFSTLIKIRPNGVRSIIVYTIFGLSALGLCVSQNLLPIGIGCVLIAVTVITKHAIKLKEEIAREKGLEFETDDGEELENERN